MDVYLSWHLRWLLHVNIVVEEVLDSRHLAKRTELLAETLSLLRTLVWLGLRANTSDTLDCLSLVLRVERCLALVVPELPSCLAAMAPLWHKLSSSRQVLDHRLFNTGCLGSSSVDKLRTLSCIILMGNVSNSPDSGGGNFGFRRIFSSLLNLLRGGWCNGNCFHLNDLLNFDFYFYANSIFAQSEF